MRKMLLVLVMLLPTIVWSQLTKDENIWIKQSESDLKNMSFGYVPIDRPRTLFSSKFLGIKQNDVNFFAEWQIYLNDCNELVSDTIEQSGTVKCELVPVKMNGKIVSYNTVPIDTVWNECECLDYKYWSDIRLGSSSYLSDDIVFTTNNIGISYSTPELAKNNFSIKRNKICMVKKRKASFEDFFTRWCVEKKLIEMN